MVKYLTTDYGILPEGGTRYILGFKDYGNQVTISCFMPGKEVDIEFDDKAGTYDYSALIENHCSKCIRYSPNIHNLSDDYIKGYFNLYGEEDLSRLEEYKSTFMYKECKGGSNVVEEDDCPVVDKDDFFIKAKNSIERWLVPSHVYVDRRSPSRNRMWFVKDEDNNFYQLPFLVGNVFNEGAICWGDDLSALEIRHPLLSYNRFWTSAFNSDLHRLVEVSPDVVQSDEERMRKVEFKNFYDEDDEEESNESNFENVTCYILGDISLDSLNEAKQPDGFWCGKINDVFKMAWLHKYRDSFLMELDNKAYSVDRKSFEIVGEVVNV